jgi:hypothetical protein
VLNIKSVRLLTPRFEFVVWDGFFNKKRFTGSAGLAVVIADQSKGHNRLFTDGRYYLQAEQQLDLSKWTLMKTEGPSLSVWLGQVRLLSPLNSQP